MEYLLLHYSIDLVYRFPQPIQPSPQFIGFVIRPSPRCISFIQTTTMKLRIGWRFVLAFIALNMVMGELHEQVHISTGYWICGCYGPRDISSWSTCVDCANPAWAFWATATGPLFSCSLMWLGAWLFTQSGSVAKRSLGFSLVFANLPFARMFTALIGGGDEKVVIRHLLGESASPLLARLIAAVVVILVCLPPVLLVAGKLSNQRRWLIIAGFLALPLLYGMLYQRMFINHLLKKGIGAEAPLFGTPNLILIHVAVMILVLFLFRKSLVRAFGNGVPPRTNV